MTQIKQMEQMRKDFIANVSHELRTPLTVMRGYLELLTESDVPEAAIWKKAHAMMNEQTCLLYTSPSPRDGLLSRMPSSA